MNMQSYDNQQLCITVLLTSLATVFVIYFFLSRRCGNYVNALTPFIFLGVPSYYLFEFFRLVFYGYEGSTYAYAYIYTTYAAGVAAKAIGYLWAPSKPIPLFLRLPRFRIPGISYLWIALAVALYAPVLFEYRDLLSSPREIYAVTRTGYGIQSFLSTFCVYVGLVYFLFSGRTHTLSKLFFWIPALLILVMHGSKGQIFVTLLIWLYFITFVRQRRFGFGRMVGLGLLSSLSLATLFYLSFPDSLREDLLESVAGYASEYTRNATLVIDDDSLDPQRGRLTLENNYYSLIPRQFFPGKRKDFGSLWLASRYFPSRFEDERGAPAFGLGVLYADFGALAIFYYIFGELLTGMIIKLLANRLRRYPDEGTFMLFLIFMDVALIPTGTGFPLIIYYVVAQVIRTFCANRSFPPLVPVATNKVKV